MKASIAYCSWVIVETISIFMIFILSCLGRDPPYQGKSGVVWAREVLVYQVQDHVIKDMVTPNNTHDRPPLLTDTPERPSVASLEETMVMHSTAGTKGQSRC